MVQIRGRVSWKVVRDGRIVQSGVNHNVITEEGEALIADLLSNSPSRTKVDGTNGYIVVGTAYPGSEPGTATWVYGQVGNPEPLDSGYPQVKGTWGGADDNVVQYRATFEAGDLNATGINEAALVNGTADAVADCLAYAAISPAVDVGSSDTLEVLWEITIGS